MSEEVNSPGYWDERFSSGDWERSMGRYQTRQFAMAQVRRFGLRSSFEGSLLDFGCGLGDAMAVYRSAFPKARLFGVDVSLAAIQAARRDHGRYADFLVGDDSAVPPADAIVASNVLEHVRDPRAVVQRLLSRVRIALFVTVPYRERLMSGGEHIHSFDEEALRPLGTYDVNVFPCRGWSEYGPRHLLWNVHAKNLGRCLLGRPRARRHLQIMFRFAVRPAATRK